MKNSTKGLRLLGISSGDPYNPSTVTGSRFYLWSTLKKKGVLVDAFSPYPSNLVVNFFKLLSFKPNFQDWKASWHTSIAFRKYISAKVRQHLVKTYSGLFNATLQTGAYYKISNIWPGYKALVADNNCVIAHATNIDYRPSNEVFRKLFEYEKEVYNSMDHIFSYSSALAESFIKDFGCQEDRVKVIYAGLNIDEKIVYCDRKDYNTKTVLFSGFNFQGKGGEVLLEAFKEVIKEFPEAKIIMLGPKMQSFPDYVINHGPLSQTIPEHLSLIAESYKEASIFALPTLGDAFPNVVREAMAAKLPCIATDMAGVPDMILDGVTGYLIPKGDSKTLAEKIVNLMKNPELCRQFGQAGYKRYKDHFTWDNVCDKIINCVNQGLEQSILKSKT